ncbi:plasmid recombination protein, partial [Staphylococcus saprophyticus]|uniref:plasmid recombination protein n=1 Tax=Staphylococcus saprophyticus TaxID=29385 RepID=UPI0016425766
MSYSILTLSKLKSPTNTTPIQKHLQTQNNNYQNQHIHHTKTYLNYHFLNPNKHNVNNFIRREVGHNYT